MTNPSDPTHAERIRKARGKFLAMAGAYSLGAFNDNFFKQAASLLAIGAGFPTLQGYAAVVFTLPFILFAAPAGWLADRFPKRRIVIAAKLLELAAMVCGAAGILTGDWGLILVMVAMMGLHSTIFSPALNGSIPELYPADYVLAANAKLKTATTTAILLGIIFSGLALGQKAVGCGGLAVGRIIVAVAVVCVAAAGLGVSLLVPRRPAADPRAKFPWTGPIDTVKVLLGLRVDRLLAITVAVDAYVWFAAALQVLIINRMGLSQFELGETMTSYLAVAELAGVAVGGLVCGKLASGGRWRGVLAPAALALAAAMILMALVPEVPAGERPGELSPRLVCVFGLLLAAGAAGGIMLVPLESFIQARPPADRKGQMIAAANFAAFAGILFSGLAFVGLDRIMVPTTAFGVLGAATLLVGLWLLRALPKEDG